MRRTTGSLHGCRILVVEDEFLLADELRVALGEAEAIVLGPVGTVEGALRLIRSERRIDGVVLDLQLHGTWAFPVADLLMQRAIPFLFATAYDRSAIPHRYADIVRCEKPVDLRSLAGAARHLVHSAV
jgi:CheY-like chemotaxis protein